MRVERVLVEGVIVQQCQLERLTMANITLRAAAACGLVGMLAIGAAAPSPAQAVVVDPYHGGAQVYPSPYAGPYAGYAYAPGYGLRFWDGPAGYDTSGMAFSYRELGPAPGPWSGAPANPCYPGQRAQNRC
jgi:hypothetical protein